MNFKLLILVFFLFWSTELVIANNGSIAIAFPIKNIKIDGDIADWPSKIEKYGVSRSQNRYNPKDSLDFSAFFQVGYDIDEKALLIAVSVIDDSHIIDSSINSTHLNQDAHLLYLDIQHSTKGSGVAMFALSSTSLRLVNNGLSWDTGIINSTINSIEHAVKRIGNQTYYEWRIPIDIPLSQISCIGLDHVIVDMDEDDDQWEYSTLAWGSNGWKSSMQNNLGDLFIYQHDTKMGVVKGETGWLDKRITAKPWGIRFISKESSNFWTQMPLRGNPKFTMTLPEGDYELQLSLPSTVDTTGKYVKVNQKYNKVFSVNNNQITDLNQVLFAITPTPEFKIQNNGFLQNYDDSRLKELDEFVLNVMEYYNIPGLSLACIKQDSLLILKNYGTKNYYTKAPVTEETLFDIGSVTKTIFALTVIRLVELGKFDLDRPLYKYLEYPDLKHDDRYKLLTARHVLSHQTGLPNWRNGRLDFINPPGEIFGYSGEGFEYLKKVIMNITSEDIETTMKNLVLDPLGIEKAYFRSNPDLLQNLSFGHYDLNIQIHAPETETFVAFGMHSNAKYFAPFLKGLLKNSILTGGSYKEMLTEQISIPSDWPAESTGWNQGYGLGFQLKNSPYGLVFGHGGRNGGFDCNYEVYTDLNIAYVFFTNSSSGHLIKNLMRDFLIIGDDN